MEILVQIGRNWQPAQNVGSLPVPEEVDGINIADFVNDTNEMSFESKVTKICKMSEAEAQQAGGKNLQIAFKVLKHSSHDKIAALGHTYSHSAPAMNNFDRGLCKVIMDFVAILWESWSLFIWRVYFI